MEGHLLGSGFALIRRIFIGGLLVFCMSGCAAIGPLLTLGGTWLTPLQYASTAYTVGEFTYEYAENGKTPDEVIEAKMDSIAAVFDSEKSAEGSPAGNEGAAPVMVAEAENDRMESFLSMSRRERANRRIELRRVQVERFEMRKMAFLQAGEQHLSLRDGHVASVDLNTGAQGDVSLSR